MNSSFMPALDDKSCEMAINVQRLVTSQHCMSVCDLYFHRISQIRIGVNRNWKQTGQRVSSCRFTPGLFLVFLCLDLFFFVGETRYADRGAKCRCEVQMRVCVFGACVLCLCVHMQICVQIWGWT